jgi:hypothetical protein
MPVPSRPGTAPLPVLPRWEETPANIPAAIRQIKAALRARIAASGRTVLDHRVPASLISRAGRRAVWPAIPAGVDQLHHGMAPVPSGP